MKFFKNVTELRTQISLTKTMLDGAFNEEVLNYDVKNAAELRNMFFVFGLVLGAIATWFSWRDSGTFLGPLTFLPFSLLFFHFAWDQEQRRVRYMTVYIKQRLLGKVY